MNPKIDRYNFALKIPLDDFCFVMGISTDLADIAHRPNVRALLIACWLALAGGDVSGASMLGVRSANWFAKDSDVLIGSRWDDLATGGEKQTILAIGYRKGWLSCSSTVSFMIFSGPSIGKSTKERMSKNYSQQIELVVNGRQFSGKTQINSYPNNGLEFAMETPGGLIAELSRSNKVLVRFGGKTDSIIQWTYGTEFIRENQRAMKVCS